MPSVCASRSGRCRCTRRRCSATHRRRACWRRSEWFARWTWPLPTTGQISSRTAPGRAEEHPLTLDRVTNTGVEVQGQVPLRETLLLLSRRVADLEATGGSKKRTVTGKKKPRERPESVWSESVFQANRVRQVQVAGNLAAMREGGGKRAQVLAEVVESECRYVNDLLVVRGVYEVSLREQCKRGKPFISDEECDAIFPESLATLITVQEAFFQKLAAFESADALMGPLLAEFAVAALRGYSGKCNTHTHTHTCVVLTTEQTM